MAITKDLGVVTAYGYAVEHGYTGTEEEFGTQMNDVADTAGQAEAWAVGTNGSIPVTESDPQYHNNAKYYAEQAGEDAESAGTSEQNADASADTAEAWAVGTVKGVPVEEGQTGYNDNAKYYAGEASVSAEAAAASEQAAKDYSDHIADPVSGIVTEWLNDHVDPATGYVIDDTLTVQGAAADAKATGDAVADLKSAIKADSNAVNALVDGGIYFPNFIQGGISKITGTDYLQNNTAQTGSVSNDVKMPILLYAGDVITINPTYTFRYLERVEFNGNGTLLVDLLTPTSPYTVETTGLYLLVIKTAASGGTLTPADVNGMVSVTTQGINGTLNPQFSAISTKAMKDYQALACSIKNGGYSPYFLQGSIGKIADTDYLQNNTAQTGSVATNVKTPLPLSAGDVITIDSDYAFRYLERVELDENGTLLVELLTPSSPYTVEKSGLYLLIIKTSASGGTLTPADVEGKVMISTNGGSDIGYERSKDPYTDIDWTATQIVTSCHAHCASDGNVQNMITAGYDAIIPTNYRTSKPWYPLPKFFPGVTDIDTYLSAPNSEVSGFNFGRASVDPQLSHISPLGSFLAVGTSSSAVYHGGFDAFARLARQTRKGFSQGGIIINHPNWSGNNAAEIAKVLRKYPDVLGIEIYNYGCEVLNNTGYSLDIFDQILSLGIQCYGFAAPDHELQGTVSDYDQPFGFINVLLSCPTDEALLAAIASGAFYSTLYNDGLKVTKINLTGTTYTIEAEADDTISIRFITASRNSTVSGSPATFTVDPATDVYIRAEVTCGNNVAYTNAIILV